MTLDCNFLEIGYINDRANLPKDGNSIIDTILVILKHMEAIGCLHLALPLPDSLVIWSPVSRMPLDDLGYAKSLINNNE